MYIWVVQCSHWPKLITLWAKVWLGKPKWYHCENALTSLFSPCLPALSLALLLSGMYMRGAWWGKWIWLKIDYVCTKVKRSSTNYFLSQNEEREEMFRGGTINDSEMAEMQCLSSIFKQIPFVPSAAFSCVQNRSSDCSTFSRCC